MQNMIFTGAATAEATNRMRELFPQVFGETLNDGRIITNIAKKMEKWGMEGKFMQLKSLSKDGTLGEVLGALNHHNNAYKNQMEPHIRTMAETVNILNMIKINPQIIDGLVKSGAITPAQGNVLAQSGASLKAVLNHELNMSQTAMLAEPILREVIDATIEIDNNLTAIARTNAMVGSVPIKALQDLGLLDNIASGIVLPGGQPIPGGAPQAPPAYGQPAYGQPTAPQYGQPPVYGQPAYGQPAYGQQPTYAQPTYAPQVTPPGQAGYPPTPIVPGQTAPAPAYDPYSNATAGVHATGTGAPATGGFDPRAIIGGFGQPAPAYTVPPTYGAYGQPTYGQPTYGQPAYSAYGQPTYGVPQYGYGVQPVAQYDAYGTAPVDAISLGLM